MRSRIQAIIAVAIVSALAIVNAASELRAAEAAAFPPGWLPIHPLDAEPAWTDVRKIDDKVHVYFPPELPVVRGVFICFVFHSADPRELARLWKFGLVTIPWPFEYDLGHNDKRNGRYKLGHASQEMGLLLRYLEAAAKETGHSELAVCPLVGWLGQNGSHLCADVYFRAPERIIAWGDSFGNRLDKYPELTAAVPFAYAWEISKREEQERLALATPAADAFTPPRDFRARASTYGFPHGIYSKFNYFAAYLDRCIALRLAEETPPAGQPTKLRPITLEQGWAGDFAPVSEWNAIAPASEARGMIDPQWFPDADAAWTWRSYHSAKPDLKLTSPVIEYRKKEGKWGGPECGLG
jgi:hypothetical protein